MNIYTRFLITMISFVLSEAFIKPVFLSSGRSIKSIKCMTKHNFMDFAKPNSVADKYFLVQSLVNQVVLDRNALLFEYCHKKLNYTDVMHVIVSPELKNIIQKHHDMNTTLELYDIIHENADDCFIDVYKLGDTHNTCLRLRK